MEGEINNNLHLYKYFRISILLLFIYSLYPWPMWSWKIPYIPILIFPIFLFFFKKRKTYCIFKPKIRKTIFVYFIFILWMIKETTFRGFFGNLLIIVPTIILICLKDEYKCNLVKYITKWTAVILGISMLYFFLMLSGLSLPHGEVQRGVYSYTHENYYLFVLQPGTFRFSSIFLEPGHMTMGIAPLLFINQYNVKNIYVLILFLAQLLSLSLAGIIVMFLGILFTMLNTHSMVSFLKTLFPVLFLIWISIFTMVSLTGMEDLVEVAFQNRIELGSEAMENRTDYNTSSKFKSLMKSSQKWCGVPGIDQQLDGSGYKKFILIYGFVGCILVVIFYFTPIFLYKNRAVFFMFIILMALFVQNAYPTWFCVLFSSIAGSCYISYKNNN